MIIPSDISVYGFQKAGKYLYKSLEALSGTHRHRFEIVCRPGEVTGSNLVKIQECKPVREQLCMRTLFDGAIGGPVDLQRVLKMVGVIH